MKPDSSFEEIRRQAAVVITAIREAPDDEACLVILLNFCSKVRNDTCDEIILRMRAG